jgi:hypothetical protein
MTTSHTQYLESLVKHTLKELDRPNLTDAQKFKLRDRQDFEAMDYIRRVTKTYTEEQSLFKYYQDLTRI